MFFGFSLLWCSMLIFIVLMCVHLHAHICCKIKYAFYTVLSWLFLNAFKPVIENGTMCLQLLSFVFFCFALSTRFRAKKLANTLTETWPFFFVGLLSLNTHIQSEARKLNRDSHEQWVKKKRTVRNQKSKNASKARDREKNKTNTPTISTYERQRGNSNNINVWNMCRCTLYLHKYIPMR